MGLGGSPYLAACHHIIYHISDMCYSLMANKIVVVVVGSHGDRCVLLFLKQPRRMRRL